MGKKVQEPIHPGEILLEDFLVPMGTRTRRLLQVASKWLMSFSVEAGE